MVLVAWVQKLVARERRGADRHILFRGICLHSGPLPSKPCRGHVRIGLDLSQACQTPLENVSSDNVRQERWTSAPAPSCPRSSPVPPSIFHHQTAGGGDVDPPGHKPTQNSFPCQIQSGSPPCWNRKTKDGSPHLPIFLNLLLRLRCRALSFPPLQLPQHGHDKDRPTRPRLCLARDPQTPTQKCPPIPPPLAQRPLAPGRRMTPRPSSWERSRSPPPPLPLLLDQAPPASSHKDGDRRSPPSRCRVPSYSARSRRRGTQPPNSAKPQRRARSSSPRRGRARLGLRRGLMGCWLGAMGWGLRLREGLGWRR